MKILIFVAIVAFPIAASAFPRSSGFHVPRSSSYHAPRSSSYGAPVHTRGYVKSNGTYVAPHYQTRPNATRFDNWSSKPNVNPMTGQAGTKDPFISGH